ncbi:hypothetical protein I6N91_05115 [Arthrobacter sp. MSA 4-2]|uniref:hypothetical protein n=1 Tax=Arthrobacter sp. MSA 4-2 TaxID=2794349 RepID=UPI0018E89096|nr:hypothetical protein [Arthrobacter sp. MSA 4-2]MBJ2120357.1 hypothetical protein [Arthrobacter sp. MSA 4-2]
MIDEDRRPVMATDIAVLRGKMTETSSALVGFAVLRANYIADAPSYVDNFRGFILGVLAEHSPSTLTRESIATEIHEKFGINIPDLVVEKILKRAKRTKHIQGDVKGYSLTTSGEKIAPNVTSLRDKYLRQQRSLEERFYSFLSVEFPDHAELASTHIAKELGDYLERHAIPVIASSVAGRAIVRPENTRTERPFDYVIARFVAHLYERDDVGFSYLEEAAKGAILSAVITLDTSSFQNSLSSLHVYLDTPVLIDLLGYSGEALERASKQLIELARSQGAQLRVFEHTLREMEGVLRSAEAFSKSSRGRDARPIDLYFQDQGWNSADILLASQKLPDAVEAMGIKLVPKPDTYHAFGLDEEKLEIALQEFVGYRSASTREFDLESLSAIHRLRRGRSLGALDRCGAVLLTDNSDLVRASRRVEGERHEWPLAMTDSALAGIIWARSPSVAPDLPRNMIVASAYAGMQPDPSLWSNYVHEVGLLEARGTVSPDEAVVLRSTTVGRNALMDETLGRGSAVTSDSPLAVLERLRNSIEEPIQVKLRNRETSEAMASASADTAAAAYIETSEVVDRLSGELTYERSARTEAQRRLREREEADNRRRKEIEAAAERHSKHLLRTLVWVIAACLAGLSVVNLANPEWLSELPLLKNAVWGATAIVGIFAVLDTMGQGTVAQWIKPVESKLADKLAERALLRANLLST